MSVKLNSLSLANLATSDPTHRVTASQEVANGNSTFGPINKLRLDSQFYFELITKFETHFKLRNQEVAKKVFDYARWTHKITWKQGDTLTVGTLKKIVEAVSSTLRYSGSGIKRNAPADPNNEFAAMFDFLLARSPEMPVSKMWKHAKSLFLEKDPAVFQAFQNELQKVFDESCDRLAEEQIDPFVMKTFVGNLLCLLPYTCPEVGKEFQIPIWKGDKWERVKYVVEKKIPLTPRWYSSPLPAYGLTSSDGPPILSFQGTTFPSCDGFWAAIVSDFFFGLPVGKLPTLLGKEALIQWITEKQGIHVYGVSLGGSIALNAATEHGQHFASVSAYNPCGFYPWNNRKIENAEVNIFSQWGDLVSTVGLFPEGPSVNMYRAFMDKDENFVKCHNRSYSGADFVTYIKTNPELENSRFSRKIVTFLHIVTPILFLPLFLIHLIVRLVSRLFELIASIYPEEDEETENIN